MELNRTYYVYILTNYQKTVVYIGVTGNLYRRILEHSSGIIDGFTKKYNCKYLTYYESYNDINEAIAREKQIKKYSRAKKNALVSKLNPNWIFLNSTVKSIEKLHK